MFALNIVPLQRMVLLMDLDVGVGTECAMSLLCFDVVDMFDGALASEAEMIPGNSKPGEGNEKRASLDQFLF